MFKKIYDKEMERCKGKTEQKIIYKQEKMKDENRRQASGESRQQVSKTLGTNERTLRKRLKALNYLQKSLLVRRF